MTSDLSPRERGIVMLQNEGNLRCSAHKALLAAIAALVDDCYSMNVENGRCQVGRVIVDLNLLEIRSALGLAVVMRHMVNSVTVPPLVNIFEQQRMALASYGAS